MPASEKLVSLFEPHADIIVKGGRDVHYGHKLNLATGRSGLILDVVVEAGNPADAERFLPMLERHIACYGAAAATGRRRWRLCQPRQSQPGQGPRRQRRRLPQEARPAVEDMVKSRWVYRKLRNFRAGIEADISCLKRAYGLARCTWRGLDHFKAYVWSAVVAYNLALFARLKPASHRLDRQLHRSAEPAKSVPTLARQTIPCLRCHSTRNAASSAVNRRSNSSALPKPPKTSVYGRTLARPSGPYACCHIFSAELAAISRTLFSTSSRDPVPEAVRSPVSRSRR